MSQSQRVIYLDHSATTPVRDAVRRAMEPYFDDLYGNPSSLHQVGRRAGVAMTEARRTVAALLGAHADEIIFTSGGTESDNAALRGLALARRADTGANRIITLPIEHKAVLYTAEDLRNHFGFRLTLLPVDSDGQVAVDDFARALGDGSDVAAVSIMLANNEVGTIQPVAAIGALCRAHGVPLHSDAVQAAGRLALDVRTLQADALSLSAHKFYGPKGAGVLYLRKGVPWQPFMTGGSHEGGRRAGTENIPAVVGMAKALELVEAERTEENARLEALRNHLIERVLTDIPGAQLTGAHQARLSHHASFVIPDVEAEGMLIGLDLAGIAASSGSACSSGSQRPSHVLEAMGIAPQLAAGGLRLSLGRSTSRDDVDYTAATLSRIVMQLRQTEPAVL